MSLGNAILICMRSTSNMNLIHILSSLINHALFDMTSSFQKTEHPLAKLPHDGIYLLIISLESDSQFNAMVHMEMRTPYGFLSAVDWPLLPVCKIFVHLIKIVKFKRERKNELLNGSFLTVLWGHVFCVCGLWTCLAHRVLPPMERPPEDSILDWWCHFPWNGREGSLLCRVPEHQFLWNKCTWCCCLCWVNILCQENTLSYVGHHRQPWLWYRQVRMFPLPKLWMPNLYILESLRFQLWFGFLGGMWIYYSCFFITTLDHA